MFARRESTLRVPGDAKSKQLESHNEQFAYIAGRSTAGAIARVIEHCSAVRNDLGQCTRNIHAKRAQHAITAAMGGPQLSVDMSTAFDQVRRSALRKALIWARASREMVHVIEKLHDQCHYHIRHAGFYGTVNMKRHFQLLSR